jgi:hypothetical protein
LKPFLQTNLKVFLHPLQHNHAVSVLSAAFDSIPVLTTNANLFEDPRRFRQPFQLSQNLQLSQRSPLV